MLGVTAHQASSMAIGTGGDALVAGLRVHGIETVFGLPGAQTYGLFDAIHRSDIRLIGARHEQACGYMAFGYARATGRPSAFTVVPGPGVLNAGAAALTALGCNEEVLCLTGQVPTDFLDRGCGHLHEMPNQLLTLRSIYKHATRVESPGGAGLSVALAFQAMHAGRPGPAAIEMPWDIFTQTAELASPLVLPPLPAPQVDTDRIQQAARWIAASRAPMIFVGSGAVAARDEILSLAERLQAPVVAFRSGRGIVSNAHELGLTIAEAYPLWQDTDVVIGIGTRLEVPRWRWSNRPSGQKTIRIDIDPAEMRRSAPDVGIVADARQATLALIVALEREKSAVRDRLPAIHRAREKTSKQICDIQPQVSYLETLRCALPAEGIVTDELSQVGFASWFAFPVYQPRTFITSGYQGNLGSGFPTALGAKVAFPSRPVVAICGDGGFMFGVQELATAAQYGINLIILLFNNNAYANVLRDQMMGFGGRVTGAILKNPDFIQLARAFDIQAERVGTPEQLSKVLNVAIGSDRPWLIEIEVETNAEASPWRFIQPSRSPTP
jgi:acetolactate synthase I/II/III large subunit